MDQHPIPQDVTGFQFKLIGTMTVKQFGYVASGVVMAVILYYLPLQSAWGVLLKVFLVPLLGASGVIIAFVPLDGRPIDVMTTNFVKALFSPNQYVYHRQGRKLSFSTITVAKVPVAKPTQQKPQVHTRMQASHMDEKEEKLRALLLSSHEQAKNAIDKKEAAFLEALIAPSEPAMETPLPSHVPTQVTPPQQVKPTPTPIQNIPQLPKSPIPSFMPSQPPKLPVMNTSEELNKKESELTQALSQAKLEESASKTPDTHNAAEQKVTMLARQIDEIHAQKQKLEQELSQLKNQLASQKETFAPPSAPLTNPQMPTQPTQDPLHVRTIPQWVTKNVGLPHVSDTPNVVVGIVKDPRGNILPNILVEVKDKDGNPVRAFKTNQLGQFASATPLSFGTYTIELDDPKKQNRFDAIQINANNTVLLPIEIISLDAREELRKQLFAN